MVTENEDIQTNERIFGELTEEEKLTEVHKLGDTLHYMYQHISYLHEASCSMVKSIMYLDSPLVIVEDDIKETLEYCEIAISNAIDSGSDVSYYFRLLSYCGLKYRKELQDYNNALVIFEYLRHILHFKLEGTEYENLHI